MMGDSGARRCTVRGLLSLLPWMALYGSSLTRVAGAQLPQDAARGLRVWSTDAVQQRFVAAHGERAVIMGYGAQGLEVWGYPFQILSHLQVGFRPVGAAAETDGQALLRRIDYTPGAITRVYIGPDYVVRETLFVPRDEPGAALSYEVQGARPLDIGVHFVPVMNLMWPGSVGGQYTRWEGDLPGYAITEPEHGYSAAVASANIVEHDDTGNPTVPAQSRVSFTMRTGAFVDGVSRASMALLLMDPKVGDRSAAVHAFEARLGAERAKALAHDVQLESSALAVTTPDEETNRAIVWAEIALDQAWVCNPILGCGLVAGYGPSRDARRPQYAWFFGGDGLVATNALVSAGEYSRAREELEFIMKYQQPKTGMIWHELSQSAGLIDWSKYPYMYVHVDITADYLATVARYVAESGDTAFAREHWNSLLLADQYLRTLSGSADGLPHIPQDKEGSDEQARPVDDLSLSAGVLAAEEGFAQLAEATDHPELARGARAESRQLKAAIAAHYWNAAGNFWIDGHTGNGAAIPSRRKGPGGILSAGVFSPAQSEAVLEQIASADFQADWGVREVALSSPDYDPASYGRGSITAPGTTQAAVAFWRAHQPEIGQAIWNDALAWNRLDSLGHVHEVFAGDFFHEQTESVPEQTWSSAGVLDAAVRGLLGLEVRGAENEIRFAPHLPPNWDHVEVGNVRLAHATLALSMKQSATAIDLDIVNQGAATELLFAPQIPLGARAVTAKFQGAALPVAVEDHPGDEHGAVTLPAPPGVSHLRLEWQGGVSLLQHRLPLRVGDPSTGMKLTHVALEGHTLRLQADVLPGGEHTLDLRTACSIAANAGVAATPLPGGGYAVSFEEVGQSTGEPVYRHASGEITFSDCGREAPVTAGK